ncbi:MAG: hypothetical protein FJX36_00395 [Alphaproteobacteria bacterium]|nr:hypothetical protein [Alphaproteobacteria bacterium]
MPDVLEGPVDLNRWPIDDLDGDAGRRMIESCRADLASLGCCNLRGFLTDAGTAALMAEADALLEHAYWKNGRRNAYFTEDDPSLPADDPRRMSFPIVMGQVAGDLIPPASRLRRLYEHPAKVEFTRRTLGLAALYPRADRFQDLNLIVLPDGGVQLWHYDQNHFSVTLLLQAATQCGDFEFVPALRSKHGEDLEAVRRLFRGKHPGVVRPEREAGTLTLFRGENAMHRVSPVCGDKARVTAILSYDEAPGLWAPDEVNAMIYGPRVREPRAVGSPI